VIEYIAFMKKWAPSDSPNNFIVLSGYVNAEAIARGLQRYGDNLTRENLLAQATSFNKERVGMLLPGLNSPIRIRTMRPTGRCAWRSSKRLLEE
jgi:branched-chain amino acid transport system substrate-binding protein